MSGFPAYTVCERRGGIYAPFVVPHLPRLIGALDRQPHSPSFGSFDREHWGWKFRDFPITMMQAAVCPLAYAWRLPLPDNPYVGSVQLLRWIEAALHETCRRQRRDGSFDSVAPNTPDHGVSLALAYFLWEAARVLGEELSDSVRERTVRTVERACAFGLESEEEHAFISNHQALFALGFLAGHEATGEAAFRERARRVVETVIERQHPDGWYPEYGGFDPGYQTLAITYLARYWVETGSSLALGSLERALDHMAHAFHPDGSVGGAYGSRQTSLYAPAGFEALAGVLPVAASIARFMRRRLSRGNVVTPRSTDAHNLPMLAYAYLAACLERETDGVATAPQMPCQSSDLLRSYESGLVAAGRGDYYAVGALDRGGVLRIFDRTRGALCYEDAGYLVRSGSRRWASQIPAGVSVDPARDPRSQRTRVTLSKVRRSLPTPVRFLLLRVLNLTLFRIRFLERWFRRRIVRHLISERRPGPVTLSREIRFEQGGVRIRDRLELMRKITVDDVSLTRAFTAFHMGSSRYFHPSDLVPVQLPDVGDVAERLNRTGRAEVSFEVRVVASRGVHVARTESGRAERSDPRAAPGD